MEPSRRRAELAPALGLRISRLSAMPRNLARIRSVFYGRAGNGRFASDSGRSPTAWQTPERSFRDRVWTERSYCSRIFPFFLWRQLLRPWRYRPCVPGIGSIKSLNLMALEPAIMSVDCRSRFAARAAAQSRVADPPGVGPEAADELTSLLDHPAGPINFPLRGAEKHAGPTHRTTPRDREPGAGRRRRGRSWPWSQRRVC
jgi:hypothetical protein